MADNALVTMGVLDNILPYVKDNILTEVNKKSINTEPVDGDLPVVYITGEIPTTKKYVRGEIEYISKTSKFKVYTYIKLQGNSSLQYPKKNFTIKLYKNEARTIKANKEFKNWGAHNNFVLKADYIDITHARNVVGANIWSQIVKSRSDYNTLPEELRNSPNNGAIDGFIVKIYINNKYEGLYNWIIPKDAWMFGMNKNEENHAVLCAETNDNGDLSLKFNPCNFNQAWSGVDGEHWSIEVGKESENLTSSFNRIYESVYNGNSTALEECLDIQSMIDYFIFQDVMLGVDGLAKNMLMITYDMTKWYFGAYDLDSICGLHWDGSNIFDSYDINMGTAPYANKFSELIKLLRNFYWDDYISRYKELRSSVLSTVNIVKMFENYINIYGEDLWIKDTISYPDIPNITENNFINLQEFIKNRVEYLDDELSEEPEINKNLVINFAKIKYTNLVSGKNATLTAKVSGDAASIVVLDAYRNAVEFIKIVSRVEDGIVSFQASWTVTGNHGDVLNFTVVAYDSNGLRSSNTVPLTVTIR